MYVVIGNNARLTRCCDGEATFAAEDELAFAKHRAFFVFYGGRFGVFCAVGKSVFALQNNESALAIARLCSCTLHVDGGTIGIGNIHVIQRDALFLRAVEF